MSESTASERPSIEPIQTDMKETPPTADMRILAEMHGPQPKGVDFDSNKPNFTFQIGREPDSLKAPESPATSAPVEVMTAPENASGQIHPSEQFNRTLGSLLNRDNPPKHSGDHHSRSGKNGERPPYLQGDMPHYSRAPHGDRPDPFATGVGDLPPGPSRSQFREQSSTPDPREGAFRFGLPPLDPDKEDPFATEKETPEAEKTLKRAGRLAGLPFVKTWMERAKSYVGKQSGSTLQAAQQRSQELVEKAQKIDPRLGVAVVGLAALYAVLLGRGGHANGVTSVAEPFPGNQYGPIERVYDRPQITSVLPAEERANTIDPSQNRVVQIKEKAREGFKDKGPDTIVEDFSFAGDKQSVKGIVEDQLAQLLNPEYKAKVAELRAQGKTVDASEGWSSGTLEDFKTKLTGQFGEQKAKDIYKNLIDSLVANQRYTIEDYNKGKVAIAADGDTVMFTGQSRELTVLDMKREGKSAIALAVKGGYSIPGDENFADQYMSNFKPGGDNGR